MLQVQNQTAFNTLSTVEKTILEIFASKVEKDNIIFLDKVEHNNCEYLHIIQETAGSRQPSMLIEIETGMVLDKHDFNYEIILAGYITGVKRDTTMYCEDELPF